MQKNCFLRIELLISLFTTNIIKKMNTDSNIQIEHTEGTGKNRRRKCVCIYNWELLFNDLVTVAAFGFAVFGAYLIHRARTADYNECENTVHLRNSAFGIGAFAIIMGILLGLSTLCCARINIIHAAKLSEESEESDWHREVSFGVYVGNATLWILAGSSVFGGIISATDNLFKTYDSTGCDSTLYGMTFAGVYVGLLLIWITLGLVLVCYAVYWILYVIGYVLYSLLIGITNISCRNMCGCYVEYVKEQLPITHKADDLVVQNITSPYNTECPVCLTQRTCDNASIFNTLSCNHIICKDCFGKIALFTASAACPLCRASGTDV
jgi:hypothetical protein